MFAEAIVCMSKIDWTKGRGFTGNKMTKRNKKNDENKNMRPEKGNSCPRLEHKIRTKLDLDNRYGHNFCRIRNSRDFLSLSVDLGNMSRIARGYLDICIIWGQI